MHAKLRQLVISALKRNHHTTNLPLTISMSGYKVLVSGEVASEHLIPEITSTIQSVSPMLQVSSRIRVATKADTALR